MYEYRATNLNYLFLSPVAPSSDFPKQQAQAGPVHQDRAYEFVECPMKAAAGMKSDIDPANMVSATP